MANWTANRISADAASKMQVEAGLLLNTFNPATPKEPEDADIICETTGAFKIDCKPETEDFFADVNNAPTNTKEGKRITGWNCTLSVEALSITEETIATALGAATTGGSNGAITPNAQYQSSDFKKVYWVGDMIDETKLFVVEMDNTVSTGGFSFSSESKSKGKLALELTGHTALAAQDKIPMTFYILTKNEVM